MKQRALSWRRQPEPEDPGRVAALCRDSGFFNPQEVAVARELVEERLTKGLASGYRFWFAQGEGGLLGYACHGPIAGTAAAWDLYWIVVRAGLRGQGLGRRILAKVEASVQRAGGNSLWVETSSRPLYDPTRAFYLARGYVELARLEDFYAPGDAKVILAKRWA